jgi:hypothetical protein
MSGVKGRSGRQPGSLSWMKNPTALAGHHLNGLIEMWLAGLPIQVNPGPWLARWLVPPAERGYTVSPKIKRELAETAIDHVLRVVCDVHDHVRRPSIEQVLAWSRRQAPSVTLRRAARSEPRDEVERAYQEMVERLATAWKQR